MHLAAYRALDKQNRKAYSRLPTRGVQACRDALRTAACRLLPAAHTWRLQQCTPRAPLLLVDPPSLLAQAPAPQCFPDALHTFLAFYAYPSRSALRHRLPNTHTGNPLTEHVLPSQQQRPVWVRRRPCIPFVWVWSPHRKALVARVGRHEGLGRRRAGAPLREEQRDGVKGRWPAEGQRGNGVVARTDGIGSRARHGKAWLGVLGCT